MSDLISRSELINALKVHFDSCFREDGELLYSDHICTSDDVVDLIKLVENQPTAYDIDKVVEELNTARTNNNGLKFELIPFDKVAEIVKQDGISDDVCEWSQTSTAKYKTECGYKLEEYFDTKACYCKQCGKKIKVVE